MKLPLLFSRVPTVGRGPTVMLARGEWKLESDHKDSELAITLQPTTEYFPFAATLVLPCDTAICIEILKQGTERDITVYANKI